MTRPDAPIVRVLGDPDIEWVAHRVRFENTTLDGGNAMPGWYVTGYEAGDRESPLASFYVDFSVTTDGAGVPEELAGALRDSLAARPYPATVLVRRLRHLAGELRDGPPAWVSGDEDTNWRAEVAAWLEWHAEQAITGVPPVPDQLTSVEPRPDHA